MVSNGERFIEAFNKLEKLLMREAVAKEYTPFSQLIERVAKKNATVRRYQWDLKTFGDLRNAIMHNWRKDYIIAEPHNDIVAQIEELCKQLTQPEWVIPRFQRQVEQLTVYQSVSEALVVARQRSYSQFPIYDGKTFVGVLTDNGLSRWLASHIEEDIISLRESPLAEVIEHEENRKNFEFVDAKTAVEDVRALFGRVWESPVPNVAAVLITANGNRSEKLLGIVTVWDLLADAKA